ncbi:hypothetical protein SBRY_30866 [Actinacidiphila bryophytorum]|uniref:Uncharacterized protein n=1 Tax=Actinacidiphila bryophytorum TaxID=1436133 RepID=A0A9W4H1U9_9ACTN|nr:hypothetical protein SBRY_30866 [Actinacidiphila bryophytorum]
MGPASAPAPPSGPSPPPAAADTPSRPTTPGTGTTPSSSPWTRPDCAPWWPAHPAWATPRGASASPACGQPRPSWSPGCGWTAPWHPTARASSAPAATARWTTSASWNAGRRRPPTGPPAQAVPWWNCTPTPCRTTPTATPASSGSSRNCTASTPRPGPAASSTPATNGGPTARSSRWAATITGPASPLRTPASSSPATSSGPTCPSRSWSAPPPPASSPPTACCSAGGCADTPCGPSPTRAARPCCEQQPGSADRGHRDLAQGLLPPDGPGPTPVTGHVAIAPKGAPGTGVAPVWHRWRSSPEQPGADGGLIGAGATAAAAVALTLLRRTGSCCPRARSPAVLWSRRVRRMRNGLHSGRGHLYVPSGIHRYSQNGAVQRWATPGS